MAGKKKGKGKRSAYARFMRNQRRGCPTPAQIRKNWRFYQKWKAAEKKGRPKKMSAAERKAFEKAKIAESYRGSIEAGHRWANPFAGWGSSEDPGRKRRGKKGKKGKGKKKLSWNRFFAKWRRKGLSPKAIGRKWRGGKSGKAAKKTGKRSGSKKRKLSAKARAAAKRRFMLMQRFRKAHKIAPFKKWGKKKAIWRKWKKKGFKGKPPKRDAWRHRFR